MDSTDNMDAKISAVVSQLAALYGFDADDAMKKLSEKKTPTTDDKIAECEKNISLWEKKLADGKVPDVEKHQAKIDKEKAKLEKLKMKAPEEGVDKKAPKGAKKKVSAEDAEKKVSAEGAEETKAKKPKTTKKPAAEKSGEGEEKEKRIKRFSPVMTSQLKTALMGVGLDVSDKLKKEFQTYIEDLTDDDFRASGLAEHMRAFAKLKAPDASPKVEKTEKETAKPATKEETSNAAGGGPQVHKLTLEELQAINFTATVDPTGPLWDADNGRFVQGPPADDDEDVSEVEFNGTMYAVGEKTGRVYEARETGDVFAGWCGVGAFKDMKMP